MHSLSVTDEQPHDRGGGCLHRLDLDRPVRNGRAEIGLQRMCRTLKKAVNGLRDGCAARHSAMVRRNCAGQANRQALISTSTEDICGTLEIIRGGAAGMGTCRRDCGESRNRELCPAAFGMSVTISGQGIASFFLYKGRSIFEWGVRPLAEGVSEMKFPYITALIVCWTEH